MLKLYDPWEDILNSLPERKSFPPNLLYYASELMQGLSFSEQELNQAIDRAFKACAALRISIDDNFKPVYRSTQDQIISDYKLSSLACYLLIINANPLNPAVAKVQLFFASKKIEKFTF